MDSPVVQALVLGVLQGLTEFLPVSSSGHLALAQQIIPGFDQPGVLLDVMLHVGTLAAVLVYFRSELLRMASLVVGALSGRGADDGQSARLLLGIGAAFVPTAVIGFALAGRVEALFESAAGVGAALICTGLLLAGGEFCARFFAARGEVPGPGRSFLIGIAQGMAVIPGISRSGATISVARALRVPGFQAARFSFLASIPAVMGAAGYTIVENAGAIREFSATQVTAYLLGPLAAGAVGYAAIAVVIRAVESGRFGWFAIYCFALGGAAIITAVT